MTNLWHKVVPRQATIDINFLVDIEDMTTDELLFQLGRIQQPVVPYIVNVIRDRPITIQQQGVLAAILNE